MSALGAIERLDRVFSSLSDAPESTLDQFAQGMKAIEELVAADREFDAAADELAEAKREKGNWRVNPLGHNHPAVLRMRAAKARRAAALANIGDIP